MKEVVTEYIDWILADVSSDARSSRRLIALIGMLGVDGVPDSISQEVQKLSKMIVLQEIFNTLVESVSNFAKCRTQHAGENVHGNVELNLDKLFDQIDETRKEIAQSEAINHPILISWVIKQAKDKKYFGRR